MVAYAFQMLSAVLLTPVLTRELGRKNFGEFSADLALLWVIIWIASAGLNVGIARVYAGEDGDRRSRAVLTGALVAAAVLGVLLYATGAWWHSAVGFRSFGAAERWAVVWAALAAVTLVCLTLLRCHDRLGVFSLVSVLQSVGAIGAGIVFAVVATRSAADVVAGAACAQAVALGVALYAIPPKWIGLRELRVLRDAMRFSLPLVPQQVAYFAITGSDRFIVQRYLGSSATGRYQVAYNVGAMAIVLLTFLNQAWLPRVFAIRDAALRRRTLEQSRDGLYRLLIPVSLGLAIGGPIALRVWAPASFDTDALTMVTLIVVVSTFGWCASLGSMRGLLAEGRSGATAVTTMVAAALNVGLNVVLVPRFGLVGSALATLASYVALALGAAMVQRRVVGLRRASALLWLQVVAAACLVLLTRYIGLHGVAALARLGVSVLMLAWSGVVLWALIVAPSDEVGLFGRVRRARRVPGHAAASAEGGPDLIWTGGDDALQVVVLPPEQIVRKLRDADRMLNEGADVAAVCRHLEVSELTYHRWGKQYGGMKADDAKRLEDLERENQRLKRIVADREFEIDVLREIARGVSSEPVGPSPGGPEAP